MRKRQWPAVFVCEMECLSRLLRLRDSILFQQIPRINTYTQAQNNLLWPRRFCMFSCNLRFQIEWNKHNRQIGIIIRQLPFPHIVCVLPSFNSFGQFSIYYIYYTFLSISCDFFVYLSLIDGQIKNLAFFNRSCMFYSSFSL